MGAGVTPENIAMYNGGIQSRWSGQFGQYNVTTVVTTPAPGTPSNLMNTVNVVPGTPTTDPAAVVTNFVPGTGGNQATFSAPATTDWVAAHEAGHLMGLPDQYTATIDPTTGQRQSAPNPGYEGNIMAQWGGAPNASNIGDIVKGNPALSSQGATSSGK